MAEAQIGGHGGTPQIKKAVAVYKEKLRPLVRNADLYHIFPRPDGIHWDGTRAGEKEPAIIYLYGEGPVATVFVDPNGKPYPLAKK